MIKTLNNNCSENYKALKGVIHSQDFPWFWSEFSTDNAAVPGYSDISIYYHSFLRRPDAGHLKFPEVTSPQLVGLASTVLDEILSCNGITVNSFLRICVNAVHPMREQVLTVPHVDHEFDHFNCLVYLSNSDGDTIAGDHRSTPAEDKAVLMTGEHYHETPTTSRRVVLVGTFL